ncbi:MAG: hypothetical protein ACE5PV_08275 [Candidatus Poribacteria bacterium]
MWFSISTSQSYSKIKNSSTRKSLLTYFMPIGVFFLILFLGMALLNTWYKSDVTKLSFKIEKLKREKALLKDELIKLNIEVERLTSPERIRKEIAPKFNMVLPKNKPLELKAIEPQIFRHRRLGFAENP